MAPESEVRTLADLGRLLRELKRRHARRRGEPELTYRALAERTGWSQAVIWEYFAGRALPPTDRFDDLVRLLGAAPAEQGALATARDRVADLRLAEEAANVPVPHQLPISVPHFAGRMRELAILDDLARRAAEAGGTVLISAIGGSAGIGKTALAIHAAHRFRDRFPDGQLHINLRGFGPDERAMSADEAVRVFLDGLGVVPQRIPAGVEARAALYRSLVADRRMLVVIDNARDTAQVRPLLPATPGCLTLVTSRNLLTGLVSAEGAHPVMLDLMPVAEARQMLEGRLGPDRLVAEPAAVDEIIDRCARLPLALAVVAARAMTHPGFSLASLAEELGRAGGGGLEALTTSVDVRAVFSWSYNALEPTAARMFRLLGLHFGAETGVSAAASLAGVPLSQARSCLAVLANANLVTEHSPGRFGCHDLLRAYASELVHEHDSETDRAGATRRLIEHYLLSADRAARRLNPLLPMSEWPVPPDVATEEFEDRATASAWLGTECATLNAAVRTAALAGYDTHVIRIARALHGFFDWRGLWREAVEAHGIAVASARRLGRPGAHALNRLGIAHGRLGEFDSALACFEEAIELFREAADPVGQAHALLSRAWILGRRDEPARALPVAEHALVLFRTAGDRAGEGRALNTVGYALTMVGDHRHAIDRLREALAIHHEVGERTIEGNAWDSLGCAYRETGKHADAIESFQRALDLFQELGDRYCEAETLVNLGDTLRNAGDDEEARAAWSAALSILDKLGHADAHRVRVRLAAI